jgi:hypothetical protein
MLQKMNLPKTRTTAGVATVDVPPAEGMQLHELSRLLLNMNLVTYDETLMKQPTMFSARLSI